jgi:hypothetical protein
MHAVSFIVFTAHFALDECVFLFPASSSGVNSGTKTVYTDPACTTVATVQPISSTCAGGRTLVSCTSDPFDFGTSLEIVSAK